jgi:hypothetical protein
MEWTHNVSGSQKEKREVMLTTTPFFVKTCFPNSFTSLKLHALTEAAKEGIFKLRDVITYFFENEERKPNEVVTASSKS